MKKLIFLILFPACMAFAQSELDISFDEYVSLASEGDVEAQFAVGWHYFHGENGIEVNFQQALYWLRLAAFQGHARAQLDISLIYNSESQDDIEQDNIKSYTWAYMSGLNGNIDGSNFANRAWFAEYAGLSEEDFIWAETEATRCIESDYKKCDI